MSSVSGKQHRFMEMVAHDPAAAKRVGVPQSVGQDFAEADKGKHFAGKARNPEHVKRLAHALRK
jgi:hypothetical protein